MLFNKKYGWTIIREHDPGSNARTRQMITSQRNGNRFFFDDRIRLIDASQANKSPPPRCDGGDLFFSILLFYISYPLKPEIILPFPKYFCGNERLHVAVHIRKLFDLHTPHRVSPYVGIVTAA